jgi:rhodanese-related sulfurtransferase
VWEVRPSDLPLLKRRFEDLLLLDCRTVPEFDERHLPGAELVPMQEISVRLDELDRWKSRMVVVYCRTGRRSRIVTRYLSHRGFACVRSLAGGIDGLGDQGAPTC